MFADLGRWAADIIAAFGYPGLASLMLAENLFPPIPSEVVLPLAGFLVGRGDLGFLPTLVAATSGSLAGALALYSLGRWGGRPLILRYRSILRVKETDLDRAEGWFEKYGDPVVLFARIVPLARSAVSIPAGATRMPLPRFALLTALGSAAWNTLLIGAGWYLGSNWQRVTDAVGSATNVVLVAALVSTAGLAIWWWLHRRT